MTDPRNAQPGSYDTSGPAAEAGGEPRAAAWSGTASVRPSRPGAASPAGWFPPPAGEAAPPVRHREPARSDGPAARPGRPPGYAAEPQPASMFRSPTQRGSWAASRPHPYAYPRPHPQPAACPRPQGTDRPPACRAAGACPAVKPAPRTCGGPRSAIRDRATFPWSARRNRLSPGRTGRYGRRPPPAADPLFRRLGQDRPRRRRARTRPRTAPAPAPEDGGRPRSRDRASTRPDGGRPCSRDRASTRPEDRARPQPRPAPRFRPGPVPSLGPAVRGRPGGPGLNVPPGAAPSLPGGERRSGWQLAQRVWQDSGVDWETATAASPPSRTATTRRTTPTRPARTRRPSRARPVHG